VASDGYLYILKYPKFYLNYKIFRKFERFRNLVLGNVVVGQVRNGAKLTWLTA